MNPAALLMILSGVVLLLAASTRRDGKTPHKTATQPRYVLAVGDSLTANGGYCRALEQLLPVGSMVQCVGFVGQGVNKIHSSVDQNLWGESDDVIVLAGVNDLASRRGVQHVVEGLERIYQEARVRGARVIAVELTPWGGHVRGRHLIDETREVNSWLDRSPSVEMVVNTSGLGIEGHLRPEYDSGDGLHLNAAGQQRLGSIIYEQVYMS